MAAQPAVRRTPTSADDLAPSPRHADGAVPVAPGAVPTEAPARSAAARRFWVLWAVSLLVATGVVLVSGQALRFPDEVAYLDLAQHLVAGHGYVNEVLMPTAYRPPGYPFWLAPWVMLPGSILLMKLLNVVLMGATLWFMHDLVRAQAPKVAWLAGAGALAYPVWTFTVSTLYPQPLFMALLMGMVWLLAKQGEHVSPRASVFVGVLAGAAVLAVPAFLPLSAVLAWHLFQTRRLQGRSGLPGLIHLGLGMALVISPWTLRNWLVMGAWIPVSTNGGINLAMGNNDMAGANTGTNLPISYFIAMLPTQVSEQEENRIFVQFALDWMRANPVHAAGLYAQKWLNFFNFQANLVTEQGHSMLKDLVMASTYYPMLAIVAVRCLWCRDVPLSRMERFMGLMYLCASLWMALFFTRIRFRLPFDALLMTWALISVGVVSARWQTRRRTMGA